MIGNKADVESVNWDSSPQDQSTTSPEGNMTWPKYQLQTSSAWSTIPLFKEASEKPTGETATLDDIFSSLSECDEMDYPEVTKAIGICMVTDLEDGDEDGNDWTTMAKDSTIEGARDQLAASPILGARTTG